MRRCLLGLVTALIVARPLVPGEDPGLTGPLADPWGLMLALLWLIAAVGWAAWRAWSRQGAWARSVVEGGLLALVGLVFASALGAARYQHPAFLIAGEWLVLLAAFCLVRQLPQTLGENQRLLAAVLATAVSLSAYALYQYAFEIPRQWRQLQPTLRTGNDLRSDPAKLRRLLAQSGIYLEPDDPALKFWDERLHQKNAHATFDQPSSFAGYLVLLFPALLGAALVGRQGWSWPSLFRMLAVLLMAAALWLTHSLGAILALLLVAGAVGLFFWKHRRWAHRGWVLAGLAGLIGAAMLVFFLGGANQALEKVLPFLGLRRDSWTATWAMIRDHLWLGVGPGNFSRYYPRYMLPTAFEQLTDPHNFVLEIWATCGLFALLALVGFFWSTLTSLFHSSPEHAGPEPGIKEEAPSTPWEFYLGGMGGMVLGYILWAAGLSGEDLPNRVLMGSIVSGVRSILWFAAFALLERVAWRRPSWVLALTAGMAALLLNLTVSGGISFPSVAQPLWIVAALALNVLPRPAVSQLIRSWLSLTWPLGAAALVFLWYLLFLFYPAVNSAAYLAEARMHYPGYQLKLALWEKQPPQGKQKAAREAQAYLHAFVITPLENAIASDPSDVRPRLEWIHWEEDPFRFYPRGKEGEGVLLLVPPILDRIHEVQEIDPEGPEGYLAEYQLRVLLALRSTADKEKKGDYLQAARAMRKVVDLEPTQAHWHYQLAEALFLAGDPEPARQEARQALDLDEASQEATRPLSASQREQIRRWLEDDKVTK